MSQPAQMVVTARAFWAPKAGNRADEYEDAFWPLDAVTRPARRAGKQGAKNRPKNPPQKLSLGSAGPPDGWRGCMARASGRRCRCFRSRSG